MIKFEEALETVLSHTLEIGTELVSLSEAAGRFLSSPVYADRDMPPYNKSAVDGYACRKEDIGGELRVIENIAAGYSPQSVVTAGCCSKIMTGAKLPDGSDTILMVEDVVESGGYIRYSAKDGKKPKNNICLKGEDIKKGTLVLKEGTFIKPEQIAILAAMGIAKVPVKKQLRVGLMSTGDEIVEPDITPDEVHIRNSNSWQLRAQIMRIGATVSYYGIIKDDKDLLLKTIEDALSTNDILIMTGGVSMGDFDFVPSILKSLNLEILFDKVAVQPGKPSTFAIKRDPVDNQKTGKAVFALPGNPVSCYVQCELLVKPFIFLSSGAPDPTLWIEMASSSEFTRRHTERKSLMPVKVCQDGSFSFISYNGSAHIVALNGANAVVEVPIGVSTVKKGDKLRLFFLQ